MVQVKLQCAALSKEALCDPFPVQVVDENKRVKHKVYSIFLLARQTA
jgi:hypothetical protein